MAKKQQIILLHGTNALTANTANLVQGEVAVYNAANAKDVEFYATDVNGNLATFQTKAATQAAIDAAKGNVELEIAALEGQLSAETSARESADNALAGRLDVIEGEGEGSIKKAVADEKSRAEGKEGELAQSITNEATARAEAIAAVTAAYKLADEALGGRIDTIVNAKPVYEIDVVGDHGDKVVVTKTENKYELNFDEFVIDGGTY